MQIRKKTDEVDIWGKYYSEETGRCFLSLSAAGDFRHHLIEELILLLADKFDMNDHLHLVLAKIKTKIDNSKETNVG